VIRKELGPYGTILTDLRKIETKLTSKHEHPFIPDKTLRSFCRLLKLIERDLNAGEAEQKERLKADRVLDEITALFENRVGLPFSDDQLAQISREGKGRYEHEIPPGYMDEDKSRGNVYGDFIIWKQMLDKAQAHKQGLIFVTNEKKQDWWHKDGDDILGPRPELRHEMKSVAQSAFYMFRADTFLRNAGKYLQQPVRDETIQEVTHALDLQQNAKAYVLPAGAAHFTAQGHDSDMLVERHATALALFSEFLQLADGIRGWCERRKLDESPELGFLPTIDMLGKHADDLMTKWFRDLPDSLFRRLQAIVAQCELTAQLPATQQVRKADYLWPAIKDFVDDLAAYLGLPPAG
jgi:hypothetical protein